MNGGRAWFTRRVDEKAAGDAISGGMKVLIFILILAEAGCVSKKEARTEARKAYLSAQAQAQAPPMDPEHPVVFVQGPVENPTVPWQDGLKLTRAIWEAQYTAFMNPMVVRVLRNGQVVGEFKGIDLLHHQDMELQAGDTVQVVP